MRKQTQKMICKHMEVVLNDYIITADDFGISPGVNHAIIRAYKHGGLTNASLLVNGKYFTDAIELAKAEAPKLKLGLHINLTKGKPISPVSEVMHLVDSKGNFKYGPVSLFLQTILKPYILKQIEKEITAQINKLQEYSMPIFHIDGHHHVQMIPGVFPIVMKLAGKYGIKRVRVVNENIIHTVTQSGKINFLQSGGLARYFLLKLMYHMNGYKCDTYFFSILNSCRITRDLVKNISIPKGFVNVEIMLHPGDPDIDKDIDTGDINEKPHLVSPYRKLELDAALFFNNSKERNA